MSYDIDKDKVKVLEDFIFLHKKKPGAAASSVASVIGVLVGLKPSAVIDFKSDECLKFDEWEIIELFGNLGLKILAFKHKNSGIHMTDKTVDVFISRNQETAYKLHCEFEKLWSSMDALAQIYDQKKWESATREIGHLLGYPDTAIESFVNLNDEELNSDERIARMERNRYFAHSAEHEEEERETYDYVLNRAINELAPKTTEILKQNTTASWV